MKAEQIARAQGIPLKFLLNILNELKLGRIVQSHRGAQGGYSLARAPESITLAEVIRAVEGPLANVHESYPEELHYQRRPFPFVTCGSPSGPAFGPCSSGSPWPTWPAGRSPPWSVDGQRPGCLGGPPVATAIAVAFPLRGPGGEPVDLWRTLVSHGMAGLPPIFLDEDARRFEVTLALPTVRPRTVRVEPGRPGFGSAVVLGPVRGRACSRLSSRSWAMCSGWTRTCPGSTPAPFGIGGSPGWRPAPDACCAAKRSSRRW